MIDRRSFLRNGATSVAVLGSGLWTTGFAMDNRLAATIEGQARNVIFLVSDGMSMGTLSMADHMLRRRDGRPSTWMTLYEEQRVTRGHMDMASLDSIVTDSSAASSSWGCGIRINNYAVNVGPEGEHHPPILPLCRDAGKATGLVTTTTVTHATPAGFAANVASRTMEEEIAAQYLDRRIDVILGGGTRFFHPESRADGRDLFHEFRSAGYRVVTQRTELVNLSAQAAPILGTFSNGHLPYAIDHVHTSEHVERVPTLSEMTRAALTHFAPHENGFVLQVEGGRVDHAAHDNDVAGLIFDQIAFDEAIAVAVSFAESRDDTLVIITSDHGNANPGLNGSGPRYSGTNSSFDRIQEFKHSNTWILEGLDENSRISQVLERIEEGTGLQVTDREAMTLLESMRREYRAVYRAMSRPPMVLGQILANYVGVNWIGAAHTSDYVELAAMGPGSEAVGGFVRNTDLFDLMVLAMGIPEGAH